MKFRSTLLPVLLVIVIFAGDAGADVYIESEQVSRGIPGQPAGAAVLKQYFAENVAMLDLGDRLTIMNFNDKLYYELNKADRTYTIGRLDQMGLDSIGIPTLGIEKNAVINQLMQSVIQSAVVTPTGEAATIAGYMCRKFRVRLFLTDSVYWTSNTIPGYEDIQALAERAAAAFRNNPLVAQMNIFGLIRELDGYPVKAVTTIAGGGSVTTLLKKVQIKSFDPDLFDVPRGYRLIRNPG